MDQVVEQRIRALAEPLWESAARPYGMAMDFWLMAEQMVLEMVAATARLQRSVIAEPPAVLELPEAAPVDRVRALAETMWESAGRQYGFAQDFWLAAERHTLALMRALAATTAAGRSPDTWIEELGHLTPAAYLERIQVLAYNMWETAGRQYDRALDFWLEAERQTLAALAQVAAGPQTPSDVVTAAKARLAALEAEAAARAAAAAGSAPAEPESEAAEPESEAAPPAEAPAAETSAEEGLEASVERPAAAPPREEAPSPVPPAVAAEADAAVSRAKGASRRPKRPPRDS